MVRATRAIRSRARAENCRFALASASSRNAESSSPQCCFMAFPGISALHASGVEANRARWHSRAATTRARMFAERSPFSRRTMSSKGTRAISICRSMRSQDVRLPASRFRYRGGSWGRALRWNGCAVGDTPGLSLPFASTQSPPSWTATARANLPLLLLIAFPDGFLKLSHVAGGSAAKAGCQRWDQAGTFPGCYRW